MVAVVERSVAPSPAAQLQQEISPGQILRVPELLLPDKPWHIWQAVTELEQVGNLYKVTTLIEDKEGYIVAVRKVVPLRDVGMSEDGRTTVVIDEYPPREFYRRLIRLGLYYSPHRTSQIDMRPENVVWHPACSYDFRPMVPLRREGDDGRSLYLCPGFIRTCANNLDGIVIPPGPGCGREQVWYEGMRKTSAHPALITQFDLKELF